MVSGTENDFGHSCGDIALKFGIYFDAARWTSVRLARPVMARGAGGLSPGEKVPLLELLRTMMGPDQIAVKDHDAALLDI